EVESHEIELRIASEEGSSGYKSDAFTQCLLKQCFGADSLRQLNPQKQSAFGPCPSRLLRKVTIHRRKHSLATLAVDRAEMPQVLVEIKGLQEMRGSPLLDRAGVKIG